MVRDIAHRRRSSQANITEAESEYEDESMSEVEPDAIEMHP